MTEMEKVEGMDEKKILGATWYQAVSAFNQIAPVTVEKFTKASVWIKGHRVSRTGWRAYFQTWDEAHAYLLSAAEQRVASARRALEIANSALGNIKGMTQPKAPT